MEKGDLMILIIYALSGLSMIIGGVVGMIQAKSKSDFGNALLLMIAGFTPGAILIGILAICCGLIFFFEWFSGILFNIFHKN